MYKSMVMHQLDYNYIAACEEWYYRCHGPQIARRYGPWLERFESYRPVPLPQDFDANVLGYTNWLTTIGYWREIPQEGAKGEMAMSAPKADARNFSVFMPPQFQDDFKGSDYAPEEKSCLRMVVMWSYPQNVDKDAADAEFCNVLAKEIASVDSVYRFFSTRAIPEEIHLPGTWKKETLARMMQNARESDHQWDRVAELWFETFDEVRSFFAEAKNFTRPSYAEQEEYPFLTPYDHYISTFLLERPAYDWLQNYNVYR
jgi:hypothetical protein